MSGPNFLEFDATPPCVVVLILPAGTVERTERGVNREIVPPDAAGSRAAPKAQGSGEGPLWTLFLPNPGP